MKRLRLGSISFINSLPVDLGLLTRSVPTPAEMVLGTPVELNEKIHARQVDAGPVSAFYYGVKQKDLLLFPDLSISSESGVQSVLLFTKRPIEELRAVPIIGTAQGKTTPALLEILCCLRYGFVPNIEAPNALGAANEAFLVIGNDALLERRRNRTHRVYDLAEEWRSWTGLPLVFAVWAVRRDIFSEHPEAIWAVHESLLSSKRWGDSHEAEIIAEAAKRTGFPTSMLKEYFSRLSYSFDAEQEKGMKLYFDYAVQCGLMDRAGELEMMPTATTKSGA